MARFTVTDWDTTAGNNGDVGGVNIAEGCPAAGINDAIRTVMAQIAAWIVAATGPLLRVAANTIGNGIMIQDGGGTARGVGYRAIPFTASSTGRALALTDVGMCVPATGAMSIPANATTAFAIGDCVMVYNNSGSSINITAAAGVTLRLSGSSSTGTRALAQRGFVTLLKVNTDEWVALNGGAS